MTVKLSDIQAAREFLRGVITPTPMIADTRLSRETGANAHLKAESLQRAGSFKIRGAYNKISRLSNKEKSRGVIAASAGNHAQGVALAASLVGIKATIVLPEIAPLTKIMATKSLGAEIIIHGATFDDAVAYSRELRDQQGYTYVHAFDDEQIIAGQGTIGLEIVEALPDISTVVVPIGGGGLISGIATAVKALKPKARIIGVQAQNVAWVNPSLKAGKPVYAEPGTNYRRRHRNKKPGRDHVPYHSGAGRRSGRGHRRRTGARRLFLCSEQPPRGRGEPGRPVSQPFSLRRSRLNGTRPSASCSAAAI
jgi:threonine dehydratase